MKEDIKFVVDRILEIGKLDSLGQNIEYIECLGENSVLAPILAKAYLSLTSELERVKRQLEKATSSLQEIRHLLSGRSDLVRSNDVDLAWTYADTFLKDPPHET